MTRVPRPGWRPAALRERHEALGLTLEAAGSHLRMAADAAGTTIPAANFQTVWRHEQGLAYPGHQYRTAYCLAYRASEAELGFCRRLPGWRPNSAPIADADRGRPEDRADSAEKGADDVDRRDFLRAASAIGVAAALPDELETIARRVHRISEPAIDDATLHQLDLLIEGVGRHYEATDAAAIYPSAFRQRAWVEDLLTGAAPSQHTGLLTAAGRLSGLLGYLAFDRGNDLTARAYCAEAIALAKAAADDDLAAWVRGTQSFIAYYSGQYRAALDLARDGQRFARGGRQTIRLAVSGEARALGKLGDRRGVDEAVGRAFAAQDRVEAADPVGYFLSFEPLADGRLRGNAATAYLALGATGRARQLAQEAVTMFAGGASPASHALTLLDLGTSYLTGSTAEPERAGALVQDALAVGRHLTSEVVGRRAQDLLTLSKPWADQPAIADLADAVHQWERRPAPAT